MIWIFTNLNGADLEGWRALPVSCSSLYRATLANSLRRLLTRFGEPDSRVSSRVPRTRDQQTETRWSPVESMLSDRTRQGVTRVIAFPRTGAIGTEESRYLRVAAARITYGPTTLVSLLLIPVITHTTCPVPKGAHAGDASPMPPIFAHPVHPVPVNTFA